MEGCPCPACAIGYTRGYLHYMAQGRELTAMRLLTLHNLAFVERVMRGCERRSRRARSRPSPRLRAGAAP